MATWSNWSGKVTATPSEIVSVADETDVVAAVQRAEKEGLRIRTLGSAHSHSPLLATNSILLDAEGLRGVVSTDRRAREGVVRAGTKISALGGPLRDAGLALRNQGDIDRQSIAGAAATGTHGTGPGLQNFSAAVLGARVVLAQGEIADCDAAHDPELFQALRLSLGSFGVVCELRLALREAYKLEEKMWLEDLDAVLDRLAELTGATRHFEFFWMPGKKRAACKSLSESHAEPVYPLAEEGNRLAWGDQVLANDRPDKHSEMEYSLPAEHGPACLRELRELIQRDFPDLAWPLEYRTLAADDVWLSTAYGRATVTISVHQGIDQDDEVLFRACESIFRSYDGRPHWGKVHYLKGAELESIHARWADWWRVRDHYDPKGIFLNAYLEGLRS